MLLIGGGLGGILATVLSNTIEWRKLTEQSELNNANFVDKYLTYVVKEDIQTRQRVAEYFSVVLENDVNRDLWRSYYYRLESKKNFMGEELVELIYKLDRDQLDARERLRTERRVADISKYLGEATIDIPGSRIIGRSMPASAPAGVNGSKLLACARNEYERGVVEEPPGSNRGPRIDLYLQEFGAVGVAWSAAFISWCLKQSGLNRVLPGSLSNLRLWEGALQGGFALPASTLGQTAIKPGDIFVLDRPGARSRAHAGIISDVELIGSDIFLVTIEGNASDSLKLTRRGLESVNLGIIRIPEEMEQSIADPGMAPGSAIPPASAEP